jgi:hypothetical protein
VLLSLAGFINVVAVIPLSQQYVALCMFFQVPGMGLNIVILFTIENLVKKRYRDMILSGGLDLT